jgi:hypothetical protein
VIRGRIVKFNTNSDLCICKDSHPSLGYRWKTSDALSDRFVPISLLRPRASSAPFTTTALLFHSPLPVSSGHGGLACRMQDTDFESFRDLDANVRRSRISRSQDVPSLRSGLCTAAWVFARIFVSADSIRLTPEKSSGRAAAHYSAKRQQFEGCCTCGTRRATSFEWPSFRGDKTWSTLTVSLN